MSEEPKQGFIYHIDIPAGIAEGQKGIGHDWREIYPHLREKTHIEIIDLMLKDLSRFGSYK